MRIPIGLLAASMVALLATVASAQDAAPAQPADPETPAPRYLAAIEAELEALSIPHSCEAETETRARCSFIRPGRTSNREITVNVVYSDESDTVYLYVPRLLTALPDAASTEAVLRRMMELNWAMIVGKLEWNGADGEVRLSMILNTDSNFDRRAFRSLVRQIPTLADRYVGELTRLAEAE